jgi:acetylglutamate kinase
VIRIVKIGGRPQGDPQLPALVAATLGIDASQLVLVHGGGDEISALQSAFGGSTTFVNGRRVTTARDIDIVRMALSGSANKRLVAKLVDRGINAVGLSGEDAGLISAEALDVDQLGYVGSPHAINVPFLLHLLAGGYVPVISPVSRDVRSDDGSALNVNGDDAAAAIAVAMKAEELILIADVEGVMSDGCVIPNLTIDGARRLIENGTANKGMRAKLEAGIVAIRGGVGRVRISDLSALTDHSRGTCLSAIGEL